MTLAILQRLRQKRGTILRHLTGILVAQFVVFGLFKAIEAHAESWIAFESTRSKGFPQIFVMSEHGEQIQQITPQRSTGPAWSPDGKYIICERDAREEVYLVRIDWQEPGKPEYILEATRGFEVISQPSLSRDGLKIAFFGLKIESREMEFFITDFFGRRIQKVTRILGIGIVGPAWSPDGKTIAFVDPAQGDIFLVDAQTFQIRNITKSPRREIAVAWAPDGEKLAVSSDEGLLLMTKEGQVIEKLTPEGNGDIVGPGSWSPDGSRIAFSSFVRPGPKIPPEIYVIDLVTREVSNLTNHPGLDQGPAWFDTQFARPLAVSPQSKRLTKWGFIKRP
ncbi:PD40 domain-containing protein [Candidatus Poribacteria bacterium]|nr:PD40 domain-containing protein [Candidatus Poribacteria bacterium]